MIQTDQERLVIDGIRRGLADAAAGRMSPCSLSAAREFFYRQLDSLSLRQLGTLSLPCV